MLGLQLDQPRLVIGQRGLTVDVAAELAGQLGIVPGAVERRRHGHAVGNRRRDGFALGLLGALAAQDAFQNALGHHAPRDRA